MKGRIGKVVYRGDGRATYFIDGKKVTKRQYDRAFPSRLDLSAPLLAFQTSGAWPMKSEGAAVHPKQIAEAVASAKKKGVPTEFDGSGRPIFTSLGHQRKYLKAYGFHNRDDNATGASRTPDRPLPEYV